MHPTCSVAKPLFSALVSPLEFHGKGVSFYRLMDGFVQSFKIYARDAHASIRFFTCPLCSGIDLTAEGVDISRFWGKSSEFINVKSLMGEFGIPQSMTYMDGRKVSLPNNQVDDVKAAADLLLRQFKKYLLPWFNRPLDDYSVMIRNKPKWKVQTLWRYNAL